MLDVGTRSRIARDSDKGDKIYTLLIETVCPNNTINLIK